MSVQDDKSADQGEDKSADQDDDQRLTEKPEPGEDAKKKAAEMMEAYKEKPTIVLPGTGGSVSGTAVNEWLDEDGNPKHEEPEGSEEGSGSEDQAKGDDAGSKAQAKGDDAGDDERDDDKRDDGARDEQDLQDQIEKDKALNEKLKEAAAEENKGEKG
ncbi:hypothetical protein [Mycobacterium sp. 852002-40037_SCH5390672]|uniref:hypothetical protein n=1 Tax=Mycobacterium sp. 852002-40037_SCH5390672 TaxID=1834089 RepID=UPI000805571C|nr:hypothetical protein [Mycobacterium sp. 852002-40037_SCH5390672]OBC00306.1 hypothetical protein A5782_21115 [Mycobacterium sp. 852002-40037_SCH5390672]